MPGAREILSFVLETDATKAVKGFEDTEKSAERMGTTVSKVGAVVAGAGVAVGLGLVGTVKQFEEAEAASNKFQTAVTGMGSKIDTAKIKRLASDLQQVSTVTNDQVIAAARWGAVYGLTTSQLEQLLGVAVDLSAQTGKSLDVVTKALAKAASGEGYTALGKLGLTFDETAYKADSFGTTVAEATAFAGGAAAAQVDTMSGQLTRLGNNWDDVKEQIGEGANEVFEPLAKAGADFAEKAAEWNPQLLKSVGHFAAIGSVAATTFGTVASIGGQIANISEGFSGLSGLANKFGISLKDAQGNATGLGKAVSGIGMGAGVVMGAVAIFEIARAIGEATENTRQFDTALKRLSSGAASSPKQMAKEFQEMSESVEGADDKVKDFFNAGYEPTFDFEGFRIEIDNATEALDNLSDTDPEQALRMIDEITKAMGDEDGGFWGSGAAKGFKKALEERRVELEKNVAATKEAEAAAAGMTVEELDAAEAAKEWSAELEKSRGLLGLQALVMADLAAATKGFGDSLEMADADELVTGALDLGEALGGVKESIKDLPKSFDETKAALGGYTEGQTKAIQAVMDWGEAAKGQLTTLISSGATHEQVAAKADVYRNSLTKVMHQAGFTDEQILAYQETLGLTPEDVNTAIKLSGDEEARFKLGLLHGAIDALPKDVQQQIHQQILMGDYQGAIATQQKYANEHPIGQPVKFVSKGLFLKDPSTLGQWNPGAGTTMAPATAAPMATTAPVPSVSNITINLPPGTPTSRTLSELRRYRRGGGDMSGLIDSIVAVR